MSNIIRGTNVSSPIVPFTTDDEFPTHDAKYGKGGFRAVPTYNDLNSITSYRIDPGMFVFVISENALYVYDEQNGWLEWTGGGGGITAESIIASGDLPSGYDDYIIQHGLGTNEVLVQIIDNNGETVSARVTRYTDNGNNLIRIRFSEIIAETFKVIIVGSLNFSSITITPQINQ